MDTWSEPGKVLPANKQTSIASASSLHQNSVAWVRGTQLFAVGNTNNVNASFFDVYEWTSASESWVQKTGYHSGVAVANQPVSAIYLTNGFAYIFDNAGNIHRVNTSAPAVVNNYLTGFASNNGGATLFRTQHDSGLGVYDGDTLWTVGLTGPTKTEIFDDGLGPEFYTAVGSDPRIFHRLYLAIGSSDGIYYVKNHFEGTQPQAWVFRVDRDVSGSYVGNPIAVMPPGFAVLSVTHHLGQLIVAGTPDWQEASSNSTRHFEVQLFFVGEGGMGSLGSVLGERAAEVDETPYQLLGSHGPVLYLAGDKRLWVYDAVRGGLHTAYEWVDTPDEGVFSHLSMTVDSDDEHILIFMGDGATIIQKMGRYNDPDTVTDFGDDETHYTLESNYFDGGLPMEEKEITRVAILRDKDDGGSEWTLQISTDDAAFADALVSAGTSIFDEADLSGTTGYQFRYKLIYQTKDTTRSPLRAVLVEMTTADMITEWDMLLDGSELMNLDGSRQDPETFYDTMVTLGDQGNVTTIIDNYQEGTRDQDADGAGIKVKVVAVEIVKDTPGESTVRVLLREV